MAAGREAVQNVSGVYGGSDGAALAAEEAARVAREAAGGGTGTAEETTEETAPAGTETAPETSGQPAGAAPETGAKPEAGTESKPRAAEPLVPKSRLDEETGKWRERLIAKGLDPDTLELIAKPAAAQPGATERPALVPGQEPWRAQLRPLPNPDYKLIDPAKPDTEANRAEWSGTAEFIQATATAAAHNDRVEATGRAALAARQDAFEKDRVAENAWRTQQVQRFETEHIPAALKSEGLTLAQFNAQLAKTPRIEGIDPVVVQAMAGAIQLYSAQPALLALRMSQTPAEGLGTLLRELEATPVPQRLGKIIATVGRLDALVAAGMVLDGKPLTKPAGAAQGQSNGGARVPSEPPSTVRAGASVSADVHEIQNDAAFFAARKAQDDAERDKRIKKRRG